MRKQLILVFIFWSINILAQENNFTQTDFFDFKEARAIIRIFPEGNKVEGNINFVFDVLKSSDSLHIDGKNMQFSEVTLNGKPVKFKKDENGIFLLRKFRPSSGNKIGFSYTAFPKKALYFINWQEKVPRNGMKEVWSQGQGRETSNWLPSFDDLTEKLVFDLTYEFPAGYELISNGTLEDRRKINDSTVQWQFDMEKPMSSYLVGVAAGNYSSKNIVSSTGDSIQLYYRPQDSLNVEPTYRYSERIFDFLENEIGVPYPWKNYKQVPVLDFLYSGMENTGMTIFSNSLMTDSIGFHVQNYVNVNAHELAHQWFGDLVTEKNSTHHWLNEGFATYFALLAEKDIFGEDYFYWKLYQTAETLKEKSDQGKGEAILRTGGSSLTYYQKGAWALQILKDRIGEEAFHEGIKKYLQRNAYKNVETDDFLKVMEEVSGQDLSQYKKDWLEQSAFKATQALESLKKSEFLQNYLKLAALREVPFEEKKEILSRALDFPVNDYIGQEAVNQLSGNLSEEAIRLYKKAFATNNLYVRQAIAQTMEKVPQILQSEFESLLKDHSYVTREAALYKLWANFPEKREAYFRATEDQVGFYNKNIRMLWLVLNLVTPDYEPDKTTQYYNELAGYTEEWRPFEVRQNAFSYLFQIDAFNTESLESLLKCTTHHTSAFKKYCRELVKELMKNDEYRQRLLEISGKMDNSESSFIRSLTTGQ
ncbi:aminopeptidase [Christiangramia fulva]|uniref:Aminopeptidase N n=1 Tax=Christiangramia fulva TaxID=2126553 RepID=A0A2R3Z680_9FLAO|nr:M1 family metallopeptidase [Christiangramia fulva]AVR45787.1 aminopeptidase [Christiangramia fulva]